VALVGVDAREFPFEEDVGNVLRALDWLRVAYPVAVDND